MTKLQFANQFCDNLFANEKIDIDNKIFIYNYIYNKVENNEILTKYIYNKYLIALSELYNTNFANDNYDFLNENYIAFNE